VYRIGTGLTLFALGALMSVTSASADSPTLSKIKQSGQITLGYRESSIPFAYLGADQKRSASLSTSAQWSSTKSSRA
jgi:glutamate/aspartate transport system substrate-binding protein